MKLNIHKILDGEVYELTSGEDYKGDPKYVLEAIKEVAEREGKRVAFVTTKTGIVVKVIPIENREPRPILCYEVWIESRKGFDTNETEESLDSSYWKAEDAWERETALASHPEYGLSFSTTILVANGMEHDVTSGVRSRRTDVI